MNPAFTADPFAPANASLRAGTTDRDEAARQLGDAYAAGKLDDDEHRERLEQAMAAKTLGDLRPLLEDLGHATPAPAPRPAPGDIEAALAHERVRRNRAVWGAVGGSLALFVFFNVIWLMPTLAGAQIPYWPIWPMLGIGIAAGTAAAAEITKSRRREDDIRLGRQDPRELPDSDD